MSEEKPHPLLRAKDIQELPEQIRIHQFNKDAIRHTRSLGDLTGLTSIGAHLVRVEPGAQSTQFHTHQVDEEFLYILSGQGTAEIGEEKFAIESGDFMGFTANSLPHNLINTSNEDLVYLMCGNRNEIDICDYPRIKRRMYRVKGRKEFVDLDALKEV
jgi:uncharacterized cupin superfamily protein